MSEFSKPLLTEEAPEPPLMEQKPLEHENERLKQTLATMQGATGKIEEAGLAPKPVAAAAKQETAVKVKNSNVKPIAKPQVTAKTKLEIEPEPQRAVAKKTPDPVKEKMANPREASLETEPDKELLLRQSVIADAVGLMAGNPDPDVFSLLFKLFANAPETEIPAAALIISMAYLRTPAKKRQPVLKALQPALRTFRTTKLAILISARLGSVLVAKPPAPPPAPPGG